MEVTKNEQKWSLVVFLIIVAIVGIPAVFFAYLFSPILGVLLGFGILMFSAQLF